MSIDRGDRIILVMLRSICCSSNRGKVADADQEQVGKTNVFVVGTQNILTRSLAGKLIGALEDRHLSPLHMKLLEPTQEMLDKSNLLKDERLRQMDNTWMMLVFRGNDAHLRASDAIRIFKNQYSLHKHDIILTENEEQAEHETEVWFKNEKVVSTTNGELPAEGLDQNGVAAEVAKENGDVEVSSQVDSEISTEGPFPSQDSNKVSSEIQLAAHIPAQEPIKEENGVTAEVISNTADILEPEDPLPVLNPTARPPSAPTVVIHQPTKIE